MLAALEILNLNLLSVFIVSLLCDYFLNLFTVSFYNLTTELDMN